MTQSIISAEEFQELVQPLIGLPVSRVWRGYGSAIFLEIGKLFRRTWWTKKTKNRTAIVGQFGVMIQWDWRVERPRSILFGSGSTDRMLDNRLPKLRARTVTSINVEGRLPELVIQLSGGFRVHTFATAEGQPEWCVFLDRQQAPFSHLRSQHGRLISETPRHERSGILTPLRATFAWAVPVPASGGRASDAAAAY